MNSNNNHNGVNEIEKIQTSVLNKWRKNLWLLLIIGVIFGINQLLFFIGYNLAGAINGSLTQKTSVFFGLILGFLILKEKVTKLQIIFSFILFFGLVIAITQGSFDFINLGFSVLMGILILLTITGLWMVGHTMTRPLFRRNEATPTQMVFIRNIISGLILISTYFFFFPLEDMNFFLDPVNIFWFFLMGGVYGTGLFFWYKTLSYLDVSKATIILSPTPIVTALFAMIILGEIFTVFHLIGMVIVIISIVIIVKQKKE